MSSDLESRGFGLEASRTRRSDRSTRLLLVMALAPHRAVSTGMRDAAVHPFPAEKNLTEPARRSCPPPDLALRPRPAPHSAPIPRPVVLGGTDGWQRPATLPPISSWTSGLGLRGGRLSAGWTWGDACR